MQSYLEKVIDIPVGTIHMKAAFTMISKIVIDFKKR